MTTSSKSDTQGAVDQPGLRDLFAGHALAALIASPKLAGVPRADMEGMARQAYEYADAMISARGR